MAARARADSSKRGGEGKQMKPRIFLIRAAVMLSFGLMYAVPAHAQVATPTPSPTATTTATATPSATPTAHAPARRWLSDTVPSYPHGAVPAGCGITGTAAASTDCQIPAQSYATTFLSQFMITCDNVATPVHGTAQVTGVIGGPYPFELSETTAGGQVTADVGYAPMQAWAPNNPIDVVVPAITGGGVCSITATGYYLAPENAGAITDYSNPPPAGGGAVP